MAQLTYQQAKALKSKIVEQLSINALANIKGRQKKYDTDPTHKDLKKISDQIDVLQAKRSKLIKELKTRHDISGWIGDRETKSFKFKDSNLVSGDTQMKIMDDLTIYTIGTDNGKVNPQEIINLFIKKYTSK